MKTTDSYLKQRVAELAFEDEKTRVTPRPLSESERIAEIRRRMRERLAKPVWGNGRR